MKKRVLFVLALAISALTGCGGSYKAPTNDYEKVKTAFNGVEKSFKKIASSKKRAAPEQGLQPKYKNVDSGLSSLFNMFSSDDIQGHSAEDLSYNEPPMVQFRYLKAVFDKVGQGFEFGTKYYDNITGDVYLDIETGFKDDSKKAENKYSYDYELAIDINIGNDDLINADVSFNIGLSQGSKTYNSKWYVNLLLDYDMEKASPNYNLTLLTENDEVSLPYFNRFTYEYDYVDVKDSTINEWRKYCMHSSVRLVKDSNHQKLTDYIDKDNIEYKVDYPKWFKNNNFYRINQMPDSRQRAVGDILFDELGLNANDINADVFFAKSGTRNSVMQSIYKEFTKIYGDDLIYDIVCRDEDDVDNGNQARIAGIRAMMSDGATGADNLSVGDMQIYNLFNGYTDPFGEKNVIVLWYCDEQGGLISEVTNLSGLAFQFTTLIPEPGNHTEVYAPVEVSIDTTFAEAYVLLKNINNFNEYSRNIFLLFKDADTIQGAVSLIYYGEFEDNYVAPTFPKELKDLGIPEYEGQRLAFDFSRNGELYTLKITGSDGGELDKYLEKVSKVGFERDWYNPNYSLYAPIFKKSFSEQENLFLQVDSTQKDCYLLKAWKEQKPDSGEQGGGEQGGGEQGGGDEEPLIIRSLSLVGSFNNWNEKDPGAAYQMVPTDANAFMLNDVILHTGDLFKFVANEDWTISNAKNAYGGYGYDDIAEVDGKLANFLQQGDATNSNIEVIRDCSCSISARMDTNGNLNIYFKNFRELK